MEHPYITSNNSSMPEVAGDAGLLVDPLSVASIQEGLQKLILDDSFRKDTGFPGQKIRQNGSIGIFQPPS